MKSALSLLTVLAFAGCATNSPPSYYRPLGSVKQYEVSAKQHITDGYSISIDGEPVIQKLTPSLFGNVVEGEGTWRGKRVRASFIRAKTDISRYTRVTVIIDGELVAILTI